MRNVEVRFDKRGKTYLFKTDLDLKEGFVYEIIADGRTTYDNPVEIIRYTPLTPSRVIREITDAVLVNAPRKPKSHIKNVIFNERKRTTVVLWEDNLKTILHCQPGETFDKEKAIGLAFMKRSYDNRSCFNDELKKWCE